MQVLVEFVHYISLPYAKKLTEIVALIQPKLCQFLSQNSYINALEISVGFYALKFYTRDVSSCQIQLIVDNTFYLV